MVTCRKCGTNRWRIFKATERSSNAVRLECRKCRNKEIAFHKNGSIFISKKCITNCYSFVPLKCLCGSNEWEILQGELICKACKESFRLDAGTEAKMEISRKTRPPKKEKDYWG